MGMEGFSDLKMEENPLDLLYSSDSDDQSARLISMQDKGSRPMHVRVTVEGQPCLGIIDTGYNIVLFPSRTDHQKCLAILW